ncbi:MAG TPA: M20/M25/M40 family metallo-hydrolase [Gemmatimonadales bacterium]|nr:M20/M25/M40 family metallo-hydrolase [Gemmatimonadales bacterium]
MSHRLNLVPKLILLAPLFLLAAAPRPAGAQAAQSPADRLVRAVDSTSYRAHLEFLASDLLEGRGTATRGGALAAAYIATQFERLGLKPAGDSGTWYHQVPIVALTPDPALKANGAAPKALTYRDDYVLWSMRNEPEVSFQGGAVFVGYGIVAPEYHWDDYAGVDVKGKVVICLVNDPGLKDSTIFRGKILTYYGRWTYKIEEAARHGAAGILMVHTTESATYPWTAVASSWTGEQVRLEQPPTSLIMAGWIKDTSAAALFAASGLDLDTLMSRSAVRGFKPVPLDFGFDATIRSVVRRSTTVNVLGRFEGAGPHHNETILIGGHYDHFGIRTPVKGDSIYNGAEDNASGTAAVIAAAEAFVKSGVRPGRSILFCAFGAEESGLLGSQALAARPPVPLRQMAAMLNMDVTNLHGRTRDIAVLGADQSSLGRIFAQAAKAEGLRVTINQDALIRGSFFRSDHFPFARAGVPALSVESGTDFLGHPAGWGAEQAEKYTEERYHQPQDEMLPWFSMAGTVQQIRVILRTAMAVGAAAGQPTWSATSEFHAAGEKRLQ